MLTTGLMQWVEIIELYIGLCLWFSGVTTQGPGSHPVHARAGLLTVHGVCGGCVCGSLGWPPRVPAATPCTPGLASWQCMGSECSEMARSVASTRRLRTTRRRSRRPRTRIGSPSGYRALGGQPRRPHRRRHAGAPEYALGRRVRGDFLSQKASVAKKFVEQTRLQELAIAKTASAFLAFSAS